MRRPDGLWIGACMSLGLALHLIRPAFAAFRALGPAAQAPPPLLHPPRRGLAVDPVAASPVLQGSSREGEGSPGYSLCRALAAAAAVGACARGLRVAMRSQGQGGRFNLGQYYMPRLKGAKKAAVLRSRKNYGSHGARKVPRRYPLYDLLEEIDETTPTYTVVSEPEEPMLPVENVPLLERYPWAGSLAKVPKEKQEIESSCDRLEPYFGSFTRQNLPPLGRRQQYVHRRGVPRYNYPPWINRPLIGEGVKVPGNMRYYKDRRPKTWQLSKRQQLELMEKEEASNKAKEEVMQEMDDDLDAALDAMGVDAEE